MKRLPTPKAFDDHFQNLPLPEQVRRAMPIARNLLEQGINSGERTDDTFVDRVAALTGPSPRVTAFREHTDNDEEFVDWTDAAAAIGIALGLLLRADVFLGPPEAR